MRYRKNGCVVNRARALINKERLADKIAPFGKLIFISVWGAHYYGFPSRDSDLDLRGVYIAPTEKLLGTRGKGATPEEPVFRYNQQEILDVELYEVGHFLRLLSNGNGNIAEFVNSIDLVSSSQDFNSLAKIANEAAMTKKIGNHYLHYAREVLNGSTKEEGVKRDLHAMRAYMTGIMLLEDGRIIGNINTLNKRFGYKIVPLMLQAKQKGERQSAQGYDTQKFGQTIQELDKRLTKAIANSKLPSQPDMNKINSFLVNLRINNLQ